MERGRAAVRRRAEPGFVITGVPDLSDPDVQTRLSLAAVPAFFRLIEAWSVRDDDGRVLVGGISNGAYYQWKGGSARTLDQDKLTRISLLVGIFKALNILYSSKLADAWVSLPNANPMFEGQSPLAYMVKGGIPAMIRVRQLLDARRGGR